MYSSQTQIIGKTFDFVFEVLTNFEIETILPMGQTDIDHPCLRLSTLTLVLVFHSKIFLFIFGCGKISFRQNFVYPTSPLEI